MLKFGIFFAVVVVFISSEENSGIVATSRVQTIPGDETCPASCREPKSSQPECGLDFIRWYFNTDTKECESFQYGGCRGNSNRFGSKVSCLERCGGCKGQDLVRLTAIKGSRLTCECGFFQLAPFSAGCKIINPPPEGYKCQCIFHWFERKCSASAIQCTAREICPSDCDTKECCLRGIGPFGGDCGGYDQEFSKNLTQQAIKDQHPRPSKLEEFKLCIARINHGRNKDLIVDRNSNAAYYDLLSHQWNLRKEKVYPLAYFVPKTTVDVEDAVKCGLKNNIPLTPRSGGHSYEGYSDGTDDSIVIDFRDMDEFLIDKTDDTVRIGPGSLLGPVNLKLYQGGNYALPMGNCFTVAIGGHAIGGGLGILSNLYGLLLDHVVELTMVDASGKSHIVSQTQNLDLFWALRGVGAGYIGIVTSFKLKLVKMDQANITLALMNYPLTDAERILKPWEKWLQWKSENDPTSFAAMLLTGKNFKSTNVGKMFPVTPGIDFQAFHFQNGDQPLGNEIFVDGLKAIWPVTTHSIIVETEYIPFVLESSYSPVIRDNYSEPLTVEQIMNLRDEIALPRYFKERSFFGSKKMTSRDLARIARVIERIPDRNVWVMISSESGAQHNVSKSATAYVHRTATYAIAAHYEGLDDESEVAIGMKWLDDFMKACEPLDNGETYQNYPDSDLIPNHEYLKRFYGSNLERLKSVKQKWDRNNYFRGPMSIPNKLL